MILCAQFGSKWPSDSGEKDENVKSLQTDGRQAIREDHLSFSSGELNGFEKGRPIEVLPLRQLYREA